jgi:phospholipid/cholesterol/gamma-HCH transport system substrate-binding protein
MDTARSALQVGILVCLGVVLFGVGYVFFNGTVKSHNSYVVTAQFKDAGGITPGAEVDMSGIKIGQVSTAPNGVRLDPTTNTALLDLRIDKRYKIPTASAVTVAASLLGGTASIAIFPPSRYHGEIPESYYVEGSVIVGQEGFNVSKVGSQTGQLIVEVSKTTEKADKLIETVTATAANLNTLLNSAQLRENLLDTTTNIDSASKQGLLLTQQLRAVLASDNTQIYDALGNIKSTTNVATELASDNKEKLDAIVTNLNATTQTLNQLMQSTSKTLAQNDTTGKLSDAVSKLDEASANLDAISSDFHKFSSDPKVQANLRTTVDNLAQTTDSAKSLVARINSLVGGKVRIRGSGENAFLANLDFSQNFNTDKFRTDVDIVAPISSTDFVSGGIYDLTESNLLNLQYGTTLPYNRGLDARAGVYAGKVGVGLDYHLFRNNNMSLDLYDPNRLHLDLKARIRLSNQAALIIGGEDLTRDSGAVVGVELRR